MEKVERILLKLVLIQTIVFLLCQIFFHHLNSFPELKDITQYEGVNEQNFTKTLETMNSE